MSNTMIFPTDDDHGFHLATRLPNATCELCKALPRWPVLKVGYIVLNPLTQSWEHYGWEFDTSAPDTYTWLYCDMVAYAKQQAEIMSLAESTECDN